MKKSILLLLVIVCFVTSQAYATTRAIVKRGVPDVSWKPLNNFPVYVKYDNGLTLSSKDNNFAATFGGYLQLDAMKFTQNAGNLLNSGTNIRRAMIMLGGTIFNDWGYGFTYDMAHNDLQNAFITYAGWQDKNIIFLVGQFSPNFSLSNTAANRYLTFMELSLPINALTPFYLQGVSAMINNDVLSLYGSVFGSGTSETPQGRNPLGGTARLVYSPIHRDRRVVDLGISDWFQKPDGSNTANLGTCPETKSHNNDMLVSTGTIYNVEHYNSVVAEAANLIGSWEIQGEYIVTHVVRNHGSKDLDFGGYYVTTSYFFTGESRSYDFPVGVFSHISPINHKYGAWQIAARYSTLNLTDHDIRGGDEKNITLGLNWYANKFMVVELNCIHAMAHPASDGKNRDVNTFALRAQMEF
jgi:phosphate-selective porin OprO and OprP